MLSFFLGEDGAGAEGAGAVLSEWTAVLLPEPSCCFSATLFSTADSGVGAVSEGAGAAGVFSFDGLCAGVEDAGATLFSTAGTGVGAGAEGAGAAVCFSVVVFAGAEGAGSWSELPGAKQNVEIALQLQNWFVQWSLVCYTY